MRVLLLEDDLRLRASYASRLRADGNAVDEVGTLAEARSWIGKVSFDCLILDRRVPDGDSLVLIEEVVTDAGRPSVLVVTALGEDDDRVRGLTAGADDYMVKPIHLDELVLRVRNLLIRTAVRTPDVLVLGRVTINRAHRRVTLDGAKVHLTRTQYAIFEQLALHVGLLVTRDHLIAHCWDARRHPGANPLHSHITRLRGLFDGCLRFEATWGTGYTLWVVGRG